MDRESAIVSRLRARFERMISENVTTQALGSPNNRKSLPTNLLRENSNTSVSSATLQRKRASNIPISTSQLSNLSNGSSNDSGSSTGSNTPKNTIELEPSQSENQVRSRIGISSIPINTPVIIANINELNQEQPLQKDYTLQDMTNINKELSDKLQKSNQLLIEEVAEVKVENDKLHTEIEQLKNSYLRGIEKEKRENKNLIKRTQILENKVEKANADLAKQVAAAEHHATTARTFRNKLESMERKQECVVCQSKEKMILFTPCNHVLCCQSCADKIATCPVCRIIIQTKVKIYI